MTKKNQNSRVKNLLFNVNKFYLYLPILTIISIFSHSFPLLALDIQVGIVQRFGEELDDQIILKSVGEGALNLTFTDSQTGESKSLSTKELKLDITPQSLPNRYIEERLILGDFGTFETAEDNANNWRRLGIQVEITQPGRWQVWGRRDTYNTPLLRRILLEQLRDAGYNNIYIETAILLEKPRVSFKVGNNTYQVNFLEVTSNQGVVQVKDGKQGKWRTYGGSFTLQPNSYGNYTLVNKVDIETYLRGVVPHEIGPNAPLAAAQAQTIIARTYALRNTRRFEADNYELCATVHCQVYYGLSGTSKTADQAIASTKGLVLTYENELVDALYSSTTGGITSNFSDIWDGENRPYLKSVIDSPQQIWNLNQKTLEDEANFRKFLALNKGFNETGRSLFRWQRQSTLADLTKDLQRYLERIKHPLADIKAIESMKITERSPSGRILKLDVTTDLGVITLEKNEVRSAFTPPVSTFFYLEPVYNANKKITAYKFIGGGFGHGVGLSQFGSYNLARIGWNAEKILQFYYPGTQVQPLNESIIFWQPNNEQLTMNN